MIQPCISAWSPGLCVAELLSSALAQEHHTLISDCRSLDLGLQSSLPEYEENTTSSCFLENYKPCAKKVSNTLILIPR